MLTRQCDNDRPSDTIDPVLRMIQAADINRLQYHDLIVVDTAS